MVPKSIACLPLKTKKVSSRNSVPVLSHVYLSATSYTLEGVWRYEYLVIAFEAFQETRVGLHLTYHDTKEIYAPGTAHDDKELPSFFVRTGAVRPLSHDGLVAQTSNDTPPDVSWAEDIVRAMHSIDAHPMVDPADKIPESSTPVASDEEYYWEVRGLYLYRST